MTVRAADQGESMAGILLLGAADHGGDPVDSITGHERVDVAGIGGHHVGLVPHLDVAGDDAVAV